MILFGEVVLRSVYSSIEGLGIRLWHKAFCAYIRRVKRLGETKRFWAFGIYMGRLDYKILAP